MYKMVFFLKRKAGMSKEAFIERYENGHARLGEKFVPEASRYVRRYLFPIPELFTGETTEPEYDVITELWFESQQKMDQAMKRLGQPEVIAEIVADEEELFDRAKHRVFMVEEHDSPPGKNQ